ncbi:hypothetical protein H633G_06468 [Metarhizium anisopliae BRIP 53284]|nr:hypothetical protein H633G_06468 [Metarhizium anisopliae BRIP 53284]
MRFQSPLILPVGLWFVSADITHAKASSAELFFRAVNPPGCNQAEICKANENKKKCCDDRSRIPFDAGYFYTGYMRACAPEYELKIGERPQHKWISCQELNDMEYGSMEKRLAVLHNWEQAGCQQLSFRKGNPILDFLPFAMLQGAGMNSKTKLYGDLRGDNSVINTVV